MNPALISLLVLISIILIIALTTKFRIHAFIALFFVSLLLAAVTLPAGSIIATMKEGFGTTMASIGFLIIFGAMIGVILDRTGGTLSIAGYILSKTGEKRSPVALGITGFITGLPIFCDSGFIVLSGLAKSLSRKSAVSMPFMATVLATSLYSVHCLIPPHPGALAASGMVNANIGYLIVAGILVAIPGAVSAWLWSSWATRKFKALSPSPDIAEADNLSRTLPHVLLSILPIAVPLLLITAKSLAGLFDPDGESIMTKIFELPGEPVIALFIGVLFSLLLLKHKSIAGMNSVFADAILKAGPILIITAAGGMFGMVIRSTGIGETLRVYTTSTIVMGTVVFACVWLVSLFVL